MNGTFDYNALSFAMASLQRSRSLGVAAGQQELGRAVGDAQPALDVSLAYYYAAFDITSYRGRSIRDYIVDYRHILHYELQALRIAYASGWLSSYAHLDRNASRDIFRALLNDRNVSVGSKLALEDYLYESGAL
jgi:hypothetical protein